VLGLWPQIHARGTGIKQALSHKGNPAFFYHKPCIGDTGAVSACDTVVILAGRHSRHVQIKAHPVSLSAG